MMKKTWFILVWFAFSGHPLFGEEAPELGNAFSEEDRAWWAIQAVVRPEVPGGEEGWAKNEVDLFVGEKLRESGLRPASEASPQEFIRRIYFDLHGLPPAPEEVEGFVREAERDYDGAVSRLVESLLDSSRYGERWAQHWLDVVRYAETDGYRADDFRQGAWRYRDYVISSFEEDKPYDQFVREQLAGDELSPEDPGVVIGTAFLRHGIYEWNQRNAKMHWELIVNEMTNATGEVFLGLGVGCAQCHDHKFDPILQKDYFALQSFLATTYWPLDEVYATAEERAAYEAQEKDWLEKTEGLRREMDEMLVSAKEGRRKSVIKQFPEDIQAIMDKEPAQRTPYEAQLAELVHRQIVHSLERFDPKKALESKPERLAHYVELERQWKEFESLRPKPLPTAFVSRDVSATPATTYLLKRSGKEEVTPAFLSLLGQEAPKIVPREGSTGRRTALADWITDPGNPLSTRVIVNRIWQGHFGAGIVNTPNDFGNLGEKPSHPELLDWLTVRFLEEGWRMKPMHHLILESATYRQTSRREPGKLEGEVDPGNRLLWRFPPARLSAEQVRDAMLAVSGELIHQDGGESVAGSKAVRSVYVRKVRNTPDVMMQGFDSPQGFESAPTRLPTTTPTQSLLLVNGEWPMNRAVAFADRIRREASEGHESMVSRGFWLAYGRKPESEELELATNFLRSFAAEETAIPEVAVKYPDETGLRPVARAFGQATGVALGEKSLWLQPGSQFETLQLPDLTWQEDVFTVEAVAVLDNVYQDSSVNTLISRWNGNSERSGWSFGVTSAKSRYDSRNLIVQLTGWNSAGNMEYVVVASNLRVPLGRPVYLAAVVSARTRPGEKGGSVQFFLKELDDPEAKLQTVAVEHPVVERIQMGESPVLVGGRESSAGHLWDGQVARLVISPGLLTPEQLIVNGTKEKPRRILDAIFEGPDGETPEPGAQWLRRSLAKQSGGGADPLRNALSDLCHALLNSNEFLYLH